jgi:hypothetical protein
MNIFSCQQCGARLDFTGLESLFEDTAAFGSQELTALMQSKVDESFVVLDKDKRAGEMFGFSRIFCKIALSVYRKFEEGDILGTPF